MKSEIYCFGCHSKLRVPAVGKGNIVCPHCRYKHVVSSGKIVSSCPDSSIIKKNKKDDFKPMVWFILFFTICVLLFSFKDKAIEWYSSKNDDIPRLEIVSNTIHVYNLHYTVGLTGFNEVNSNMTDFDELIWDKLRTNSGMRNIVRHNTEKDQYGNLIKSKQEFGTLNLDELNKYKSFDDFKRAGGFYAIMNKK